MREFDILNEVSETEYFLIEDYFDSMGITEEEKEKRKSFAQDFLETMLFIFALISVMYEKNYIDKQYAMQKMQSEYLELAEKHGIEIDDYIDSYISDFSEKIIDTTMKHLDEEYFLSVDRALLIGENESNSVFNYNKYSEAVKKGKTRKRWITEGDDKVRKTHRDVDLEIIPIDETFIVGNSLMRFPKDEYYNAEPEEVCGCRCIVEYF